MTDETDLDSIKERKKTELLQTAESGTSNAAPDEPIHVESQEQFRSLVDSHDVVMVDFHADWCGPCKMLEPTVEELAAETDAAVAKVDVDRNQQLAGQYGVQGVPMLLLFADGEPVEKMVGVQSKDDLAGLIDAYN